MPSSAGYVRDYAREYAGQKRRGESGTGPESGNARRKRLRRLVLRKRAVREGEEVDHVQPLSKGGGNGLGNARVVSQRENRSFPRNADGSVKGKGRRRES